MALQDIINDLIANNAKTDGTHYSVDQLKNFIVNASVEVPGTKPGATTLTYSGKLNGIDTWRVAEQIGKASNGQIRTIGQTEASQLLGSEVFTDALRKATGYDESLVNRILDGTTTNGVRNPDGLGDTVSRRFIDAADGPLVSMTSNADSTRIWAQTELDTALNNSKVPSINGIPREDLVRLRSDLLATGPITKADIDTANKIVLDHVNNVSARLVSEMRIAVDTDGKFVGADTKEYFNKIGMPGIGTDLPTGINGHSPVEWIAAKQTPESLRNADLANDHLKLYGQERLSLAHAAGDAGKIADAAHYLNKLGIIGDTLVLGLAVTDANAAYAKGDSDGAQQILGNWALEYAGGMAGGIAAAQLMSSILAPLYLTGPAGAIVAGALSLLAGIFGSIGGEKLTHVIADLFTTATQATQPIRSDPLVFDLDKDGLETTGISATNPIYFDHDDDGIKTASGWVKSDDAFLVLDKNANGLIDSGRELFGDATFKSNGRLASDGFDALQDLDSNADGKINSSDSQFANLRLWRDLNQDGISQSNELFTLSSQNIAAINVASTDHSQTLSNGNQLADIGSFIKDDGSSGTLGEVSGNLGDINLAQDTFHSQFTGTLDTSSVAQLPNMQGAGQVRSLREAATLSPALAQVLSAFAAANTRSAQQALLDPLLKAWSDTSKMPTSFTGAYAGHSLTINGLPVAGTPERQAWEAKITLLERFNGRTFNPVPGGNAAATLTFWSGNLDLLNQSYKTLAESVYGSLVMQTRLKPYLGAISLTITNSVIALDFNGLNALLESHKQVNAQNAFTDLLELQTYAANSLNSKGWKGLDRIIQWAGELPGSVNVSTLLSEFGYNTATSGNDIFIGSSGGDNFNGQGGYDSFFGGLGNDTLTGHGSFEGGFGDDVLAASGTYYSNSGDTYLFNPGDGKDTIIEYGYNEPSYVNNYGAKDVLKFGAGIAPASVSLARTGNDLIFKISATDQVAVKDWFVGTDRYLEEVQFADGSKWDFAKLQTLVPAVYNGSAAGETINGWNGVDNINGLAGNDTINGYAGNDIIDGGNDNDTLNADDGNDQVFGGSGCDVINGGNGNDLLDGGDDNDTITDASGTNVLKGGQGNDTLTGHGSFEGGLGDDVLAASGTYYSNSGDTYLFNPGDGKDTIIEYGYNEPSYVNKYGAKDVLKFGAGIAPASVSLARTGNDLIFKISATDQVAVKDWFVGTDRYLEEVQFADGSKWDFAKLQTLVPAVYNGSAAGETINGWNGVDNINGLAGNDTINGYAGNDIIDGGNDNDTLNADDGNDQVFGGSGCDVINGGNGNDLLDGGDDNDTITDASGTNVLKGGQGNDTLTGHGSFEGGLGDDVLAASGTYYSNSGDTYLFNLGDGKDTIIEYGYNEPSYVNNYGAKDVLKFGAGIAPASVSLARTGNDLIFKISATDQVAVKDWFVGTDRYLEEVQFADGSKWDFAKLQTLVPAVYNGSAAGETINGWNGVDNINGLAGNDTINGYAGNDIIDGGNDNDTLNADDGNDQVFGGSGCDVINGGNGNDLLDGGDDNDTITDASGTNVLKGGQGNDTLTGHGSFEGGLGDDVLAASGTYYSNSGDTYLFNLGDGKDTIIEYGYNEPSYVNNYGAKDVLKFGAGIAPASVSLARTGNDLIFKISATDQVAVKDWFVGTDRYLEEVQFTDGTVAKCLGLAGTSGVDFIIGTVGNDIMSGGMGNDIYLVDAAGDVVTEAANAGTDVVQSSVSYTLAANIENLILTGTAAINAAGNSLNNILTGNSSANSLSSGAGNDLLDGGAGADILLGGLGDDTYIVDMDADVVTESVNEGIDTVESSISYTLSANLENLTLTGTTAINGTGNTLNNVLTGNSAANILTGGAGDDTYIIGTGDSVVETAGAGIDTIQSGIIYTLGANVENLILIGSSAINGTGNALDNILTGNSAANTLSGGAGADTMTGDAGNDILNGGLGADTMSGGLGDDSYYLDNAADAVIEIAGEGNDIIYSSIDYSLGVNLERLYLTGTHAISATGNELNNTLYGHANSAVNTLSGGLGNDVYYAGAGDNVVENAGEGTDSVYSYGDYTLGDHVENLYLNVAGAATLTGNALANSLRGNAGNDTLNGGEGNDILNGGLGADSMSGGLGDDSYYFDNAADAVMESIGEGNDIVYSSIDYTLGVNLERLYLTGTEAISATGNELNNTLYGHANSAVNTFVGGLGNDVYYAGAGDNVVENAGEGTDSVYSYGDYTLGDHVENLYLNVTGSGTVTGNALANSLRGNAGNDTLNGGDGNDTLNGGLGADSMSGGLGDDSYYLDNAADAVIENAGEGNDIVYSSIDYTLGVNLERLYLTGTEAISATGNELNNTLYGHANSALNTLSGGLGNDVYYAGAGDNVVESAGEGTDSVYSYGDHTLSDNIENLTLSGALAIKGTGNELNNVLTGNNETNVLIGGAGNDTLNGGGGADTLDGGIGNDRLLGGAGNDTYLFGRGSGADILSDYDLTPGNTDALTIDSGVATDQLWFHKAGSDLAVSIIGTTDKSTISNWYSGNANHIEQFKTAEGKMLLDSQVDALVSAMAAFAPPAAGQTTLPPDYQAALAPVLAANWK